MRQKHKHILLWAILLAACYCAYFLHLDALALQAWDESLFMMRAIYLLENGEMLSNFNQFENGAGLANAKFSLLTYVQAFFLNLFGYNTLAIRLPIALLALATTLFIFFWVKRETNSFTAGWVSAMILVGTSAYSEVHMARTGDHDVGMAFFTTVFVLLTYRVLWANANRRFLLGLLALGALVIAILIKSLMPLLLLPGVLLGFLFYWKEMHSKAFFLRLAGISLALSVIGAGLLLFFVDTVWLTSALNKTMNLFLQPANADHDHGVTFYFDCLVNRKHHAMPWVLILPFALFAAIKKETERARIIGYLLGVSAFFVLLLSLSATKTYWYLAALYPLLAVITGLTLYPIFQQVKTEWKVLLFVVLIGWPVYKVGLNSYNHYERHKANVYYDAMNDIRLHGPNPDFYYVYTPWMNEHITFYAREFKKNHGIEVHRVFYETRGSISIGDTVLSCHNEVEDMLPKELNYEVLHNRRSCTLLKIVPANALPASSDPCPPRQQSEPAGLE